MKYKLTKKNYGTVMHILNTFFKKDCFLVEKDVVRIKWDLENDYYEEISDDYSPVVDTSCGIHPMYRENKVKVFSGFLKPILALHNKYQSHVLPLYEGDLVEYKGTRLRIRTSHRSFNTVKGVLKVKEISYRWHEWVQYPISPELKEQNLRAEFADLIIHSLMEADYFRDEFETSRPNGEVFGEDADEFYKQADKRICRFVETGAFSGKDLVWETDDFKLELLTNLEEFRELGVEHQDAELFSYSLTVKPTEVTFVSESLSKVIDNVTVYEVMEEEQQLYDIW